MGYKATVPAGQPRTLRSIADQQNDGKNFQPPPTIPEEPKYKDDASTKFDGRREGAASKNPIK